jgi:hypothetical protein
MFRPQAALALAVLLLTGCGAVEASTAKPEGAIAAANLPCSLPYGTHVELVSPAPGSAGVSPGTSVLVVASRELPKSISVVATGEKGVAHAAALERIAAPAHAAQAPFPAPVYYRASVAGLLTHRHYTVALDDVAQNSCSPYARIAGNPRFST